MLEELDVLKPDDVDNEGWQIDSMEKADWALSKISAARKVMQQNADYVQSQVEKLQAWLEKMNKQQEGTISFFEGKLASYVDKELEGSKKKSISLPNGVVGFRKKSQVTKDEAQIMEFLKNGHSEFIKTKEIVDLAELKKACKVVEGRLVTEDGEIVPGYNVTSVNELYTKD